MTYAISAPGSFVNLAALPHGHWIGVRLPDGRHLVADETEPAVTAMRKVNKALAEGDEPRPEWFAAITGWLDTQERGQLALWQAA